MKTKRLLKIIMAFAPATLWALIIFILSAQQMLPGLSLSTIDFIFKKTAHMFVYAVLYWLLLRGFKQLGYRQREIWLKALFICLLYAISDELHQSTVAGRSATLRDIGYDFLGASLVFLAKFSYI